MLSKKTYMRILKLFTHKQTYLLIPIFYKIFEYSLDHIFVHISEYNKILVLKNRAMT